MEIYEITGPLEDRHCLAKKRQLKKLSQKRVNDTRVRPTNERILFWVLTKKLRTRLILPRLHRTAMSRKSVMILLSFVLMIPQKFSEQKQKR